MWAKHDVRCQTGTLCAMAVNHEITSKEELADGFLLVRCSCGDEIEVQPRDKSAGTPRVLAAGGVTIESMDLHWNLYRQSVGET
jgi:hypothetical protein